MTPELNRLIEMHTYKRPAGSRHERKFINRYLVSAGCVSDAFGNYSLMVGNRPDVVWSTHTDTVHKVTGRQRVYLESDGTLGTHNGDCLGADDTAGVWLLCEMIRRGVPGRYVFHYGEERGCIGSRSLVASAPAWLADARMVIALDRKGTADVITHQCGNRTCSDDFAHAIADQFNAQGLRYEPSDWGMFTDSESYADDVAECTNLSIGYSGAHSARETLDTRHALALLDCLCALDTSVLPVVRIPGARDDYQDALVLKYLTNEDIADDDTLPVAGNFPRHWCRECGEDVSHEWQSVCWSCGCDDPIDVVGERDFIDSAFARAQAALRAQVKGK